MSVSPALLTNTVDSRYRLSRSEGSRVTDMTESPGVSFYQNVLSLTLGSHCALFPSDSAYAQVVTRKCGGFTASIKAMARFYYEPDAGRQGAAVFVKKDRLYFEDLPYDCQWF